VFHTETLTAQARLTEDNEPLSAQNHLLHVMEVEPSQDERLAEGVCVSLLQGGFENLFPTAKAEKTRLDHFATKTDLLFGFLSRETGELAAIFMPPRIMRE
jgi:hypothetical protein